VVERGEAWEAVLKGQVLEHGEAIIKGMVPIYPPFHSSINAGVRFEEPPSFIHGQAAEGDDASVYSTTSGFHLREAQVVYHREVAGGDPDDLLETILGCSHPFLLNRYPEHYRDHLGYVIWEAVVPAGEIVTVCGYSSTPDKTMTILPTVVIEASGLMMWCGTCTEAPPWAAGKQGYPQPAVG